MSFKPTSVLKPATEAVLEVCSALDGAIGCFLEMRNTLSYGKYEADVEALLLFNLTIRHVEAVITLARQDLVLLPAAYSLARVAFECGVRSAWLVNESDPLLREARWLAHLDSEITAIQRVNRLTDATEAKPGRVDALKGFRDAVANKLLENNVRLIKKLPTFADVLLNIGGSNLYKAYIEASQYTHGSHAATRLYRSGGLGTYKKITESISPQEWILPLRMCWLALGHPGEIVINRIKDNSSASWSNQHVHVVTTAFQNLVASWVDPEE